MKKSIFAAVLLAALVLFAGCSKKNDLNGKWETTKMIIKGQEAPVYESYLKFEFDKKNYKVKGMAGVNLFNATATVKGPKFHAANMNNTGFSGTPEEMDYEDYFFTVLMNAENYKVEQDILKLKCDQYNMELWLTRK